MGAAYFIYNIGQLAMKCPDIGRAFNAIENAVEAAVHFFLAGIGIQAGMAFFEYAAKYPEVVLQVAGAVLLVHNIGAVRKEIASRSKQQHSYACINSLHGAPP